MRALSFYALGNAWLLSLLVPLVLLYFLKLKRMRLQVPSLALWRQVLADKRVNSPFQRLKRNLLLLLQILLLLLLIAAALQPIWRGKAARSHRIVALIDCSASMAGLDGPDGVPRLEIAKEQVGDIVDGLLPDQELCIISFSDGARKRTDFTNNKRLLRRVLREIRVEDVPSEVEDALRMTEALAWTGPLDEVLIFSDGNFPERAHLDLALNLTYHRLPAAGPNVGITSLNARRWAEGDWDVLVLVQASSDAEGTVTLEISQDGEVVGARHVSIGMDKEERVAFRVSGDRPSALEVKLIPAGFDSLSTDNVAYLGLPAVRPLRVYVPAAMSGYRHALRALKGISVVPGGQDDDFADSDYDLVITDRPEDAGLEANTRFTVGFVPDDLKELLSVTQDGAVLVDWSRSSPLLQHVELNDLLVLDRPVSADGVGEGDFENLGYEVLVHAGSGPLLLQKRDGERLSFHLLFHTDRSTLPYRVAFPVLVSNLAQVAMHQAGLAETHGHRTGVLSELVVRPDCTYEVTDPSGGKRAERSNSAGLLPGIPAPWVGHYSIAEGGREEARVGASLLAADETTLKSVEEIEFEEDLFVSAFEGEPETDRPLWRLLAIVAFCVLLVEWWYFQRGVGGYAR